MDEVRRKISDVLVELDNKNILCVDCLYCAIDGGRIDCKEFPASTNRVSKVEPPTRIQGCKKFKWHWYGKMVVAHHIRNMSLERNETKRLQMDRRYEKNLDQVKKNPIFYRCRKSLNISTIDISLKRVIVK